MQYVPHDSNVYGVGGRISSPEYREAQEFAEHFEGLPEGTNRYDLLMLAKDAGKGIGFSPRTIELLEYYIRFTRECDWEKGARPIVYQSLSKTALDLGVSERQIQRLEKELAKLNAITWNDSGNHRRYGKRNERTGVIEFAFGVDLTPLAALQKKLEQQLVEKEAYDKAWMEAKRQISFYRRQIKARVGEGAYYPDHELFFKEALFDLESISVRIRTHMDLTQLEELKSQHKEIFDRVNAKLEACVKVGSIKDSTQKESSKDSINDIHYNYTNKLKSNKLDTSKASANVSSEKSVDVEEGESSDTLHGLEHISVKMALNSASERFRARIPLRGGGLDWLDIIEAAYEIKRDLGISQYMWSQACQTLTRTGAAIAILITDQATQREIDPVRSAGGYFKGMIDKAQVNELKLHASIFGILKRGE